MQAYRIHLIRNATTQGNLDGRYCGRTDEDVCPQGRQEILYLDETYSYPQTDFVFVSPLKSCVQTADLIYPDAPRAVVKELRECDFGDFEGKTADDLAGDPEYKEWLMGGVDACPPGGESNKDFSQRVCSGFVKIVDGLISSGIHNAAIVTHGGVIMSLLAAFGIPQQPMSAWLTPAGCGYTLLVTPGVWASHRKAEVYLDIPERPVNDEEERELWDWYPDKY